MIDELPGRAGATLGTTDPPRHDRLRALSQAAFARKNVEQLIAPTLDIADRALVRICERKEFEFINDFSSQITVGVLFRTMGLPERDHADIRRKVILAVSTDKSVKGRNPEHIAAFKELSDFLTAEVAARRVKATDDHRRPQGHLGFGAGKHFCLGSQMARLVTAVAMKRFLERVPDYHLAVDEIAWNSSSNFRSPSALPFVTH